MRRILLGATILLLIAIIILAPAFWGSANRTATIRIPRNATSEQVSDSLSKYLGEKYAAKVMKLARFQTSDFSKRRGAYEITKGMSPLRAAHKIARGGQTPVRVTINGFRGLPVVAERIAGKLDIPADSITALLADPNVTRRYGLEPESALALFIDDSFDFYWTASARDVIEKIGDNYLKFWNKERTTKAEALGITPLQAETIASIVDEETNNASEKGKIGRLYLNRFKKGMRLQACPTIRFAVGDFTIQRVLNEHLYIDSPYNTYRNAGLPPGPIRTTRRQTVDALLDSEPNDYLFMCAKEDFSGTHNFASTFAEHSANATRYRKALNAKGIH